MALKVTWTKVAILQLKELCHYVRQDSLTNSQKVRKKILSATKELGLYPEKHPPDKYKTDNDGTFRGFVLYHYRISYQIEGSEITILRIRHTSMEPLNY